MLKSLKPVEIMIVSAVHRISDANLADSREDARARKRELRPNMEAKPLGANGVAREGVFFVFRPSHRRATA
jgi:hypothetical protein